MDDLELEQRFLASARRGQSPAASDAARIRSALATRLLGGADTEAPSDLAASDPTPLLEWLPKLLVLAAVSGVSAGAGYVAGKHSASTAPLATSFVQPSLATSVPLQAAEPVPAAAPLAPLASAPARSSLAAPARPRPPDAEAIEHEVQTVRRVERALRAGNPQLALSLLAELDADVPGGKLLEERRAAFTVASCEIGFGSSPQSLLEKFEKQFPGSVYLVRVRASCTKAPAQTESAAGGDLPIERSEQ